MNRTDVLHRALEKYRLNSPIQSDIQVHILKTRRASLKALLKKTGKYGALAALAIIIYIAIRKIGIAISIFQAKVIAVATAGAVAASASAGGYVTAKQVYHIIQNSSSDTSAIDIDKSHIDTGADSPGQGMIPGEASKVDSATVKPSSTNPQIKATTKEKQVSGTVDKSTVGKPISGTEQGKPVESEKEKNEAAQQVKQKKIRERTGNVPTL